MHEPRQYTEITPLGYLLFILSLIIMAAALLGFLHLMGAL